MKKPLLLFVSLLLPFVLTAQIPPGYYNSAAGLSGPALQLALHNIIDNHTTVSYNSLWTHFQDTDKKPNGKVWDMYSDVPGGTPPYQYTFVSDQCGNYGGEGDCYNREHSWPQSWFNSSTVPSSDLFHLYPTDGYVNNMRGNLPYGTVGTVTWTSQNGSKQGYCIDPGYSSLVFEPIDEYKGDFARTYFYMSTRYHTEDASWSASGGTNKSVLLPWEASVLLTWSHMDSVSTKEIDRNNEVYGIQNNRNPFIDNPAWADSIWSIIISGIEENAINRPSVNIYPNPSEDAFFISNAGNLDWNGNLSITNALGQVIQQSGNVGLKPFDAEPFSVSCSTWDNGVYYISLIGQESSGTFIFIKL